MGDVVIKGNLKNVCGNGMFRSNLTHVMKLYRTEYTHTNEYRK